MEETLLNYRMFGKGHSVVFLHGFLESISMWKYLDLENQNFQSILIDLPGHGLSKNVDNNEPSLEYMARKVMEVLFKLEVKTFSVVGHSMGGYVGLILKELNNCDKVILLNSNFWEDTEEKKRDRLRVVDIVLKNKNLFIREAIPNLFSDKKKFKDEIEELIDEAIKMDSHAISYASLAMRNRKNKKSLIQKNSSDFVIFQGLKDSVVLEETMRNEIKDLGVRLETFKKSGHMAHIEESENVINLISDVICN
jgi:pimeloyl-ACP methyl ester carboxylesterase